MVGVGIIAAARRRSGAVLATDPYWDNVKLLIGADVALTDESASPHSISGGARNTSSPKFGAGCLNIPATLANSVDWQLGSGDFTIETFVRFDINTNGAIIGLWDISTTRGWVCNAGSNSLSMNVSTDGSAGTSTTVISATPTLVVNQYYHIVFERSGTTWRIYVDGAMLSKVTSSLAPFASGAVLGLGVLGSGVSQMTGNGLLDEVRLTKGVARYASDAGYTVPTFAFPRSGAPPVFTVNPSITTDTGFYGVGDVATVGGFTHNGASTAYQWTRDGANISGATSASYTYVSGDSGHTVTSVVTATNGTGSTSAAAPANSIVTPTFSTDTRVPAGDMQSGSDSRLTAGDMQSGTDLRLATTRTA